MTPYLTSLETYGNFSLNVQHKTEITAFTADVSLRDLRLIIEYFCTVNQGNGGHRGALRFSTWVNSKYAKVMGKRSLYYVAMASVQYR